MRPEAMTKPVGRLTDAAQLLLFEEPLQCKR